MLLVAVATAQGTASVPATSLNPASTNCVARCPQYFVRQTICASDGNLYTDECRAKCTNSRNYELFNCENRSDAECTPICRNGAAKLACDAQCPQYFREQLQCASNGRLYTDQCRARCELSTLTILFDCGFPINRTECQTRCTNQLSTGNNRCPQCANQPVARVCGANGTVYDNSCLATCNSTNALYEISGANSASVQNSCQSYANVIACQRRCSTGNNRAVCASDGFVYSSSCVAQCGGLRVINNCSSNSNILSCFRDCRGNN